jgi:hypothetical protein
VSDLGVRLAVARELLGRTLDALRDGTMPVPTGDRNALDRDEALAVAAKADAIAFVLRHPPAAADLAATVDQPGRRGQGGKP